MSARELEPLRTLIANLRKLAHEWPDKSDVGKAYSQGLLVSANKLEALLPALESALAARAAEPSESAKKLAELITRNCVHTDGSSFDEHVEKTAALLESFARSYHAAQIGRQARADALREAARKLCMRCELDGDPRDCINDSDQPRDGGPRFIHIDSDGSEHECVAGEVWAIRNLASEDSPK